MIGPISNHRETETGASVNTALGEVSVNSLGQTLMHEHIFIISNMEMQQNYPDLWDEDERVSDAVARLNALKNRGIDTIVDHTVIGLGRYIPRIQNIAQQVSVNILVATGIYTYGEMPMYFAFRGPGTLQGGPEPLTEMFLRDIEQGIGNTGVRASLLKCVVDEDGVTPSIHRVLQAVSAAHRQSGVPISTHTSAATRRGLDQQRVFREEGVDLNRVIIGHSGDTTDIEYLEMLVTGGSYIGMDRFGLGGDNMPSFEQRVDTVATLCERGYAERIVLSHDALCYTDCYDPSEFPDWHYNHIPDAVVPALLQRGVRQSDINTMLISNPRRIFSVKGNY